MFILLLLLFNTLSAQISVDLLMPDLRDGLERVESLLYSNIGDAVSELETVATESLQKPKLTGAFGDAAGLTKPLPIISSIAITSKYSISLGSYASISTYTMDRSRIESDFDNMEPEDDMSIGANAQFLNTSITLPLNFLVPRLSLFASLGYIDFKYDDYFISNLSGTISTSYTVFRTIGPADKFKWTPITVQGGFSYGINRMGATIDIGVISDSFELDPDGDGPLLSQSIEVEIEPEIDVAVESNIGALTFNASTGVTILDSIHLYIGGGINFVYGDTSFTIDSDNEIVVVGYLSELIDEPGRISISGTIDGDDPEEFVSYLFTTLQFEVSSIFFNINALYQESKGISAGVSLGVFF